MNDIKIKTQTSNKISIKPNELQNNITVKGNQQTSSSLTVTANTLCRDYDKLTNLPSINDVTLIGNKTTKDLGIKTENLISISYQELVELRSNSLLQEGVFYRIIDYVTTCNGNSTSTAEPARSAQHPFDIIVQATGTSNLSEIASCALREDDTYFAGQNLGAWQIWYDINNDTSKYTWADTENGKGVIYRMIDEKFNDLPYDFKNIQFYRDKTLAKYSKISAYLKSGDDYYYTFSHVSGDSVTDYTLQTSTNTNNKISVASGDSADGIQRLNNIVFLINNSNKIINNNTIATEFYNNTFAGNFYSNTFSLLCYNNLFVQGCYYNSFSNGCYNNVVDGVFSYNKIGTFFRNSTITGKFQNNVIGNYFNNTIKADFLGNLTDTYCTGNTFNGAASYNTFGQYFQNNVFNGTAQYNNINKLFQYNTVGTGFASNNIQNWFTDNVIGSNFTYNTIYANDYQLKFPNNFGFYTLEYGLIGKSTSQPLDFTGLPTNNEYSIRICRDSSGRVLAIWNDGLTAKGLYKEKITDNTWVEFNT